MNLDLQEKVKLWRSTDETAMLGKSQTFSQTTESTISGILSGKRLKNNLGNRQFKLWGNIRNRRKTGKCKKN